MYRTLFVSYDTKVQLDTVSLGMPLPSNFYKMSAGYLTQLTAEVLFVKSSVFLGGRKSGTSPLGYEDALGSNFEVITTLYPRFIDPYYFCQSFLTPISPEAAAKASTIFETGISAFPKNHILRFFHASNFFLSMDEPLKGAKAFEEASLVPGAPPMFARMAVLLSARGGNLKAGLMSLKVLYASEKDEKVRIRYEQEIESFEKALTVQIALDRYIVNLGGPPRTLEQLIPDYLSELPEIGDSFHLVYKEPTLSLRRPVRN